MKKLLTIIALVVPITSWASGDFFSQSSLEMHYSNDKNNQPHPEGELVDAVMKGANYWQECLNKKVVLGSKKSSFNLTWTDELNEKEFADVIFKKRGKDVIEFNIRINSNKSYTLKQVEYLVGHEMGHLVGVPHTLSNDSVMYYGGSVMIASEINKAKDNTMCIKAEKQDSF